MIYPQLSKKRWLKNQIKKKPLRQIAKEIGCSYGGVSYATRKFKINVPQRNRHRIPFEWNRRCSEMYYKKWPNGRFGKLAANWKGGKRKGGEKGQYWLIYSPKHPNTTHDGYVMEHRLVMEKYLGRYLK